MKSVESVSITDRKDILRAAAAFRDAVLELHDLRIIMSDNIASRRPMMDADNQVLAEAVFGFSRPGEQWWKNGQLALRSPLARACRYENEPFWANAQGFHTHHPNRYLDAISRDDWEKRALVRAAIVVPVYLPFGQIGMAAFGTRDNGTDDLSDLFARHADRLMLLTHRFVSSYVQVTRMRQWVPADCALTKREVECLRWAAIGKTDRDIAEILTLSHATVRFHLSNAGEKLNAVNRAQTVFRAGQLGYLGRTN